jgi:uncharacterized membrane protein
MKASDFFTVQQQNDIVQAIKQAELNTSGEIRVHIELKCTGNVLDRASNVFAQLKMHKTEQRNGVLFYLALTDKQFAVIGDVGINKLVQPNFWDSVKNELKNSFSLGNYTQGLVNGILMAGEKLKSNFPYQSNDVNELPDEISFGK